MDQNQFTESGNSPPPSLPILTPEDREEILANYIRLKNANLKRLPVFHFKRLPTFKPFPTSLPLAEISTLNGTAAAWPLLWWHDDNNHCYCKACVDDKRNPPKRPAQSFLEQMLAHGFKDADGIVPTTDLVDDIIFIRSRIDSLKPKYFESISKAMRDGDVEKSEPLEQPKNVFLSRPLQGTQTTTALDHWFPVYWCKTDIRVAPNNAVFHERLLDEIEKVELNHDLPSGGTRSYSFSTQAPSSTLLLHWTDARFEGKPYLIDDASTAFVDVDVSSAAPEEWTPPRIQVEHKRNKKVITNVRCRVCGALDKQKYPGSVALCRIDSDNLCNRKACIRARAYDASFDSNRLRTGYPLHELFAPPIHPWLFGWARSNERNESDPNLKCDLRYDLDRRGRRGIKAKTKDYEDAVTQPARIHTAENTDLVIRYAEDIFHATLVEPVDLSVKIIEYDKTIHRIVGDSFEERQHVPNYKCFALNSFVGRKTPSYFDFGNSQVPCVWVDAFIIQGTAPYHIREYRDPTVSKLDEIKVWSDLKTKFREAGWKWYDPNKLHSGIITLWKDTTGAADEIRRQQLEKIRKLKANGRVEQFIEDIYLRKRTMKETAKEQKITPQAIKQKVYRRLNKQVLSENEMWSRPAKTCKKNGVYALATLGGQTRAYLLLAAATKFPSAADHPALKDSLHNIICDILYRRAKKGTIEKPELKAAYREIYDAFCNLPWRLLRDGKWYDHFGEVVMSSTH